MALIKCPRCGKHYPDAIAVCPGCGFNPFADSMGMQQPSLKKKSKIAAGILCLLFWSLGVHEFYLGDIKKAIICLFSGITCSVLSLYVPLCALLLTIAAVVFAIKLFAMPQAKFDAKYNAPESPKSRIGCGIALVICMFALPGIVMVAVMLLSPYFTFVHKLKDGEKSYAAEGVSLVKTIASSQQRQYLRYDNFTDDFKDLDIENLFDKDGNAVKSGNSFVADDFIVSMKGSGDGAYVEAVRDGGDFQYTIRKYYMSDKLECIDGEGPNNETACKDLGLSKE